MAGTVCSVLGQITCLLEKVITLTQNLKDNNAECRDFINYSEGIRLNLQALSTRLQRDEVLQEDENLPHHLTQLGEALRNALETCYEIRTTGWSLATVKNFFFSGSNQKKLERARICIQLAMANIHLALDNNSNKLVAVQVQQSQQNEPPISAFTPDGDPPNAVRSVKATVAGSRAIIRWYDTANIAEQVTRYEIHVKEDSGRKLPVQNVTAPATSAAIELNGWKTYSIQVRAVNHHGNSPLSPSQGCVVYMNQSPPTKPSKPLCNIRTSNSIAVTVSEPRMFEEQGITQCIIKKQTGVDGNWKIQGKFNIEFQEETFVVKDLDLYQSYRFCVQYKNQWGTSEETYLSGRAIRIADVVPGPPENLDFPRKSRESDWIVVTWNDPSTHPGAVHHYIVEMKRTCDIEWTRYNVGLETSYLAYNLKSNTTYQFRVHAVNRSRVTSQPSHVLTVETMRNIWLRTSAALTLQLSYNFFTLRWKNDFTLFYSVLYYDKYAES